MDEEAESSTIFARLRSLVEHTLMTKCLHDSMRQGMLSHVRLMLEQLAELCAATGKFKYMRLITDFRFLVKTMPLEDLVFVLDMTFADLGSYYAPADELTELFHWLYEKLAGRRREHSWVAAVARASTTLPVDEPGSLLGSRSGNCLAPTGFRDVDSFIANRVQVNLEKTVGDVGWTDRDGKLHLHASPVGFWGAATTACSDNRCRRAKASRKAREANEGADFDSY
jgi:hypothetical protein